MRQTTVLVLVLLFHHAFSQVHRSTIEKGDKKNNELFSSLNLWTIESKKLKESFDVIVKTPLGYSDTERSYPMLFVLDADATYGMASEIPTLLLFEGSVQRVIVVGVSYQSFNSWLSKRERDLTPSQDPKKPTSGQSLEFLSMIAIEIIPSIEDRYRVDSSNRILYGHLMVGYLAFSHYSIQITSFLHTS